MSLHIPVLTSDLDHVPIALLQLPGGSHVAALELRRELQLLDVLLRQRGVGVLLQGRSQSRSPWTNRIKYTYHAVQLPVLVLEVELEDDGANGGHGCEADVPVIAA